MYHKDDDLQFGMQGGFDPDEEQAAEQEKTMNQIHNPEIELPKTTTLANESSELTGVDRIKEPSQAPVYNAGTYGSQRTEIPVVKKPMEPEPRYEKKSSLGKRILGITAAALLFGTVAGGTMVGINAVSDYLKTESHPAEETTETAYPGDPDINSNFAEETVENIPERIGAAKETQRASMAVLMDVSDIVEKAMPSVVAITNTMVYERQNWFGQTQSVEVPSSGSGIIIGENEEELLIVTNNHVVSDSKTLTITFIDDTSVDALIKGTDEEKDLAVIAVSLAEIETETLSQIEVATLGDSDSLKVGQGVIAIGNALGYGQSVTVGYVSALDREVIAEDDVIRNLLQTDAAINPGNSGGALLNMNGEVIGINAAKYSGSAIEGMGYAIPISKVQDVIDELMIKRTRLEIAEEQQGYLGIQGQNIDETTAEMYGMPRGIYVFKIVEDGAAAQSDLREKDIITKFDGQSVKTMANLKEMLTYYESGSTITLTVYSLQDGQYVERSVEIVLGNRPQAE